VGKSIAEDGFMKKINIGSTKASDYFGVHVIHAHQQFLRISNLENAMAAAKALWENVGWLWSDRHPGVDRRKAEAATVKAFDDDLFKRCPDLQLLRDLTDAAKHGGVLQRRSVVVTGISGCGSPGGTSFTSNPFGPTGERPSGPFGGMMVESTPECTLRIEHAGGSRDLKEALATAFKFLQAETS
jgi:hypothetical protein